MILREYRIISYDNIITKLLCEVLLKKYNYTVDTTKALKIAMYFQGL